MKTASDFEAFCCNKEDNGEQPVLSDLLSFFMMRDSDYLVMPRAKGLMRIYFRVARTPYAVTADEQNNLRAFKDHTRNLEEPCYVHNMPEEEVEDTMDVLNHKAKSVTDPLEADALRKKIERAKGIFY